MATQNVWPRFTGPPDLLRVSASDVQTLPEGCGLYGGLKVRHKLRAADWKPRKDESQPFILGVIRDVSLRLHNDPKIADWEQLDQLVGIELAQYDMHPSSRRYATRAIENYLNCHDLIESEIGKLELRICDPQVVPDVSFPKNQLTVWAPFYDNDTGVREVRKLRFGRAMPPKTVPDHWAITAAYIASLVRPQNGLQRIRVIEIGLGYGSMETLFDGSPADALSMYESHVLPVLRKVISSKSPTPGPSCQKCKIAGCCSALEKLDGFLGQTRQGHATRSISARDLEVYEKCPAQWHMSSSNFPGESQYSSASERGKNVHNWLARAHSGNRKCDPGDLDFIDEHLPASMDEAEYMETRNYITQHATACPIGEGSRVIGSEVGIYGYDAQADVVIVSKPDLLYIDADDTFVIRETKTTNLSLPADEKKAYDKFFAVPWLLNLIGTGYRGPYQSDEARLELEVLAPDESRTYAWDLNDSGLLRMARAEVRARAKRWHKDVTWASAPGEQCRWCPVRQWCPDAKIDEGEGDE